MNAINVGRFTPGSPEWDASRRDKLGGSSIAAVLGLSPWQSKFSLWHEKAGNVTKPHEENQYTEWGQRLEAVVAAKFCENHPELTPRPDTDQGATWVPVDRPWQAATPDLLFTDTLLEVKTAQRADRWGTPGTDEIPINYRCQVLWYLDVFGMTTAHIAVLISGCDYREYRIDVDDDAREDMALMRKAGEAFMASLATGTPPPLDDGSYHTLQTVRELHPDIEAGKADLEPALAARYIGAAQAYRDAKKAKDAATAEVLNQLGDVRNAVADGHRFAYRSSKRHADGTPGTPYLATDWRYLDHLQPSSPVIRKATA